MATLANTPQTLTIDRLNKSYGSHQVLTDMSLQVSPGEINGFVGFNDVDNACRTGRVGR